MTYFIQIFFPIPQTNQFSCKFFLILKSTIKSFWSVGWQVGDALAHFLRKCMRSAAWPVSTVSSRNSNCVCCKNMHFRKTGEIFGEINPKRRNMLVLFKPPNVLR